MKINKKIIFGGRGIKKLKIQSPPSMSTPCIICKRRIVSFDMDNIAYNKNGILSIPAICPECQKISMYMWEIRNESSESINLPNR